VGKAFAGNIYISGHWFQKIQLKKKW